MILIRFPPNYFHKRLFFISHWKREHKGVDQNQKLSPQSRRARKEKQKPSLLKLKLKSRWRDHTWLTAFAVACRYLDVNPSKFKCVGTGINRPKSIFKKPLTAESQRKQKSKKAKAKRIKS
jgi:hypothetical protein